MAWCLTPPLTENDHRQMTMIHRFDPRFWTVDFPRPMLGCVVATAPDALRATLAFTGQDSLAGLIWESKDRWDHPLLAYLERRDYRHTQLRFRWRSGGMKPLDAVHGPTLTIEGRDAGGTPRSWYVRLWNYAQGTPEDAVITLDFDALTGGFDLQAEADPVWAGDIDRMFLSLVPPEYDESATPFDQMRDGWVEMTDIAVSGSGAVLPIGDAMLPDHGLSIATGYDDAYNLTPQRVMRQVEALGYRGPLLHYVGMSHIMRLSRATGAWRLDASYGVMAGPAADWHRALAAEVQRWGGDDPTRGGMIWSLSYELFADYCPGDWMQRAADGTPALTGWSPPSALLSPAHPTAMTWLQWMASALMQIAVAAGLDPQFQVGEPWWWITADRKICLYDYATSLVLGDAVVPIPDMGAQLTPAQTALLDAAGALLAQSTIALADAAATAAQAMGASKPTRRFLLAYLPTILDPVMPQARRANMPVGWAKPAFDVLQLEDYDWVTRDQPGLSASGRRAAVARLGYAAADTHYLSGFVLKGEDRAEWAAIARAAAVSRTAGDARTFIWALPQVSRDGFYHVDDAEEEAMQAFDDVAFPLALGREAEVVAEFSTAIITGQSGREQRAPDWGNARLRFDAGPGIRSEGDVQTLIAFYRARRGPAVAFRFRDPFDWASSEDGGVAANDQWLGNGDGLRTDFALVKRYGGDDVARRITRPVGASVRVSIDGVEVANGWALDAGGVVRFAVPPVAGAVVAAGFLFDVPVRFAEDRLSVSRATYLAGEIASVPLVEVREA